LLDITEKTSGEALICLNGIPIEIKPIGGYSFSRLEAGRLESLEAQKFYVLLTSQHSGFPANNIIGSSSYTNNE
jgi:hypothetical protein